MPELKFAQIQKQLASKDYQPIYFFQGEEAYFIDELSNAIEKNALQEHEKAFNQTIVYGRDIGAEVGKIIDAAMRLPMMAERQVVIIKEAQHIRGWENLIPYLENPTKSTILVFAHKNKKIDGRGAFAKKLKQHAVLFTSKEYKDYQVPAFITEYVQAKDFTITPKSTQLLVEFLGTDLSKISNELEKLFLVLKDKKITPHEIEENIGISKDYNVYELQNAFLAKDAGKVFQILHYFKQNPKAGNIVYVITVLYGTFSKLFTIKQLPNQPDADLARAVRVSPFFFKDYKAGARNYSQAEIRNNIKLLSEYDLKGKGLGNVSLSGDELMKEMALKILF